MTDQQTAATLASDDTKTETIAPVNDGFIDLDAPEEVKEKTTDDDGEPKPAAPKAGEEEQSPKKPSGAQRAKAREARLLSELSARDRELEELRRNQPAAKIGESEEKPPREEDYNGDYFAWQRALTAFEAGNAAKKAVRDEFKTVADSKRSEQQAELARERKDAHLERVEDARDTITDFDQVMETMKNVNVRQDVIDEIMSSDKSALLAYHLAQNPDKLTAMDRMSPRELAREMGRLEATVQLPEAKRATTAPPPLGRVNGGASPASQDAKLSAWLKKTYG